MGGRGRGGCDLKVWGDMGLGKEPRRGKWGRRKRGGGGVGEECREECRGEGRNGWEG